MSRDLNIERSSTRLHAPPGGKSSFSIGGYPDEPVKKPVAAAPAAAPAAVAAPVAAAAAAPVTAAAAPAPVSHRAEQSSMGSLLAQDAAPAQRTAVRVRQAPGGASSIVIG